MGRQLVFLQGRGALATDVCRTHLAASLISSSKHHLKAPEGGFFGRGPPEGPPLGGVGGFGQSNRLSTRRAPRSGGRFVPTVGIWSWREAPSSFLVYAQVTPPRSQLIIRDGARPSDKAAVRLAGKLALHGATVQGAHAPRVEATWEPYCDAPVRVVMRSHPRSDVVTVEAAMRVPCRKCAKCKQFRQMQWRQRMFNELAQTDDRGRRSWFVTLTFSELHLAGIYLEGVRLAKQRGSPLDECIERCAYAQAQLFHKRLRKCLSTFGTGYRFVCVPEYGKLHGRLHYHLLLHETAGPVTYRQITSAWRSGFIQAKLVDADNTASLAGAAGYVSKYLTKNLTSAVRASGRYGNVSRKDVGARSPRSIF